MQTTRTPYSVSFMATVLLLLLFACHSTIANAAVALGATRVIYPANQKQVLLPVTNNDPASVYLIQITFLEAQKYPLVYIALANKSSHFIFRVPPLTVPDKCLLTQHQMQQKHRAWVSL